jgi:uncharacterized protein with beta-barrel porin domain
MTRNHSRYTHLSCAFALAALFCPIHTRAQLFDNGSTNTITSSVDYNDLMVVGSLTANNVVDITSNAVVGATRVLVGEQDGSTNNTLSVIDNALLLAGNVDTNGLTTGGIVVGATDDGRAGLVVAQASTVNSDYLYVGFGTNDSGKVELIDENTQLNVADDVYIGYAGSTNSANVGEGSLLRIGRDLHVGFAGGSNNTVNINSGGTLYVNSTNNINVVNPDSDNMVNVYANGTMQVGGDVETGMIQNDLGIDFRTSSRLEVGGALSLSGNKINDQLSILLNNTLSTNDATLQIGSGTFFNIGDTTSNNSLTLTNGATAESSIRLNIGNEATANNNSLVIGGAGSSFTGTDVLVGARGSKNSLLISDGGSATASGNFIIGKSAKATNNDVTVGSNGVLNVGNVLIVGDFGKDSTFSIDNGTARVGTTFVLGLFSANNRYLQSGGTNTVTGSFFIGEGADASGNTGTVNAEDIPNTSGNLALVEDRALLETENLTVGLEGSGSILTIRDGGMVNVTDNAVIGEEAGDNYIYLQRDADTRFNVDGDLTVGKTGEGSNRFAVYGGTATIGGDLLLGATDKQHDTKNFIYLETTNAVLNVAGAMHIGASNSLNTLDIVKGATAGISDLLVGVSDGVSNNVVTVTGEGSLLHVTNTFSVGSASGSGNTVVVEDGGVLNVAQAGIAMSGTNNTLEIADGGTLQTGDWDFSQLTGAATNILFGSGSTLHLSGILSGTNTVAGGVEFLLDGATWDTTTNSLFVGNTDGNNSLSLTNGAFVSTATNLYIGYASKGNMLTVSGSTNLVGHDLFIGADSDLSSDNVLYVMEGGLVSVANDLHLFNDADLSIDSESRVVIGNDYNQDASSSLRIGISSNSALPNLEVAGTANMEKGASLVIFDDGLDTDDTNFVHTIVQAGKLTIDNQDATTVLLRDFIDVRTNLLLGFDITVTNRTAIVLDNFIVRRLEDIDGLDGQLLDIAKEISDLKASGNPLATNLIQVVSQLGSDAQAVKVLDNHYGEKMSSSPAHNMINLGLQGVAERLTTRTDSTRDRMGVASASLRQRPSGTAGPHTAEQELQGWLAGYGTWADQDAADGFDGYESDVRGFLIGADLSVADNILFGIAGGRGTADVDKNNGATSEAKTTHGAGYVSLGTTSWFADAALIYGFSTIKSELGDILDTAAEYDAENFAILVGGGKEFISKYLIVTPQASFLANYYNQDAYTETSTTALPREVEGFDALYLQSSLGCNIGLYAMLGEVTLKPEFRLHWQHEFNAGEESLSYALVDGTGSHILQLQAPEEDILKIGAGVSAKLGDYLEIRADLDSRQAANYSDYTLTGTIRYQF